MERAPANEGDWPRKVQPAVHCRVGLFMGPAAGYSVSDAVLIHSGDSFIRVTQWVRPFTTTRQGGKAVTPCNVGTSLLPLRKLTRAV